jgi:type VI secretion system Hcp family effector
MAYLMSLALQAAGSTLDGDHGESAPGRHDTIQVLAYESRVEIPQGSASDAGKRRHGPITIRKPIDRSSPLLLRAMVQNQTLSAMFSWFDAARGPASGDPFFIVKVAHAHIVLIRQLLMPASDGTLSAQEEVHLAFDSVTWESVPGKVASSDIVIPV